jgi:hypothetical protein
MAERSENDLFAPLLDTAGSIVIDGLSRSGTLLEVLTEGLKADCDHAWEVVDDSYDHEFGTENIVFERCIHCDEEREHEPRQFDDNVI